VRGSETSLGNESEEYMKARFHEGCTFLSFSHWNIQVQVRFEIKRPGGPFLKSNISQRLL